MSNPKLYLPNTNKTPKNYYYYLSNQNKLNYYINPESNITYYHQINNQSNINYNYINSSQAFNSYQNKNQQRRHNTSNSGDFLYSNYKQYNYLNTEFINLRNSINELNEKIKCLIQNYIYLLQIKHLKIIIIIYQTKIN
jgi:predicted transcriptional regulator